MSLGIHSGMNWQEGFGISEMSCYISSIIPCKRLASVTCLNWPTCIQHEQHSHLPCPEYRTMNTTHEQNNPAAALRQQDCHDWRDILVPSPSTGGNIREGYCNGALYSRSIHLNQLGIQCLWLVMPRLTPYLNHTEFHT